MDNDFIFQPKPFKPLRKVYYSHKAALEMGIAAALLLIIFVMAIGTVLSIRALCSAQITKKKIYQCFNLVIIGALFVWLIVYLALPKVATGKGVHRMSRYRHNKKIKNVAIELAMRHDGWEGYDLPQVVSLFINYFKSHPLMNPYESQPIRLEDSLGNYTIYL